jgi:hypothetical protein
VAFFLARAIYRALHQVAFAPEGAPQNGHVPGAIRGDGTNVW